MNKIYCVIWHDLRKDPTDIPSENECVLNQYGQTVFRIGDIWYDDKTQCCATVILWCYIPTFDVE